MVATVDIEVPQIGDDGADEPLEPENRYLLRDHQGSVIAIIEGHGEEARLEQQLDYGVWGNRRPATGGLNSVGNIVFQVPPPDYSRGYTGHEHLDGVGLVHMNGRVYDPEIGRFLSPDPFVPEPGSAQSYNRYTYVNNDPLSYTDPSGYSLDSVVFGIVSIAASTNPVTAVVMGVMTGYMRSGGNTKAALYGGAGAALGMAAGAAIPAGNVGAQAFAQGAIQGAITHVAGGRFQDGFIGGVIGSVIGGAGKTWKMRTDFQMMMVSAVIGGTASKINGGSFSNGAISAAFSYAVTRSRTPELASEEVEAFQGEGGTVEGGKEYGLFERYADDPMLQDVYDVASRAQELSKRRGKENHAYVGRSEEGSRVSQSPQTGTNGNINSDLLIDMAEQFSGRVLYSVHTHGTDVDNPGGYENFSPGDLEFYSGNEAVGRVKGVVATPRGLLLMHNPSTGNTIQIGKVEPIPLRGRRR